jgi:hypothetical protein
MLSCEDLDGFLDQLCDVTRDMDNVERIIEASELLEKIDRVPRLFVMQWRAAAAADEHYLNGATLRDIAAWSGRAFQGVSQWLKEYGPTHYLSLIEDAHGVRPKVFAVEGAATKSLVRRHRRAGRRIVPAVMNLYDPQAPGGMRTGTNLDSLWEQLGD